MILELLVTLLLLWYIVFHIKRRRLYELAAKFDGPSPLPVVGNALKCIMPISEMPSALLKSVAYYKSPIRFWFGPHLVLYISDPEDIKTVVNSSHALDKPAYLYSKGESIIGRGLVVLPGEIWKRHRRLISPSFSQQNLKNYFSIFCKNSKGLTDNLRNMIGKGDFDAEGYIQECTMQNVFESLLDFNLNEEGSISAPAFAKLFKRIASEAIRRTSNILYSSDTLNKMSTSGKKSMQLEAEFAMIINSIIEKWKSQLTTHQQQNKEFLINADSTSAKNFVEHLLLVFDEKGKLTSEELQHEIKTMICVGFDTTANTMGFFLLMMGMHPEVQERIFEEIKSVLGAREQVHYEDLKNFLYLETAIKETLRLFPVLASTGRYNDQEIQLDEKRIIPSNTNIFIGTLTLHRDPNIWPNPTQFDPDRFLPEQVAKRHPYSWIPFSAGPRNCIGLQFAMMSMKSIAIHLIRSYIFRTPLKNVEDIKLTDLALPKCVNGFQISISAR